MMPPLDREQILTGECPLAFIAIWSLAAFAVVLESIADALRMGPL